MALRLDDGSGTPVVLLHGFPGAGADWEPVAGLLSTGCRAIVVDLVGFGASPRPDGFDAVWTNAQAEALHATLDRLGVGEVALVGHDMGGPVALTYLGRFPERVTHLGLSATNTFTDTPIDFPLSLLRLPVLGSLLEPVFLSAPALRGLGRAASRTKGVRATPNDAGEAKTIRTIFSKVLRDLPSLYRDIEAMLPAIAVPTTVIWGDADMFFTEALGRRTAETIPGAEFVVLEGCGHFTPIERPDEVAAAILRLLARDGA